MESSLDTRLDQVSPLYGPGVFLGWLCLLVMYFFKNGRGGEGPTSRLRKNKLDYICLAGYFGYAAIIGVHLYFQIRNLPSIEVRYVKGRRVETWASDTAKPTISDQSAASLEATLFTSQTFIRLFAFYRTFFDVAMLGKVEFLLIELLITGHWYLHGWHVARADSFPNLTLRSDAKFVKFTPFTEPWYGVVYWVTTTICCVIGTAFFVRRKRNQQGSLETRAERGEAIAQVPRTFNQKIMGFIDPYVLDTLIAVLSYPPGMGLWGCWVQVYHTIRDNEFSWRGIIAGILPASNHRLTDLSQALPLILALCAFGYRLDHNNRVMKAYRRQKEMELSMKPGQEKPPIAHQGVDEKLALKN